MLKANIPWIANIPGQCCCNACYHPGGLCVSIQGAADGLWNNVWTDSPAGSTESRLPYTIDLPVAVGRDTALCADGTRYDKIGYYVPSPFYTTRTVNGGTVQTYAFLENTYQKFNAGCKVCERVIGITFTMTDIHGINRSGSFTYIVPVGASPCVTLDCDDSLLGTRVLVSNSSQPDITMIVSLGPCHVTAMGGMAPDELFSEPAERMQFAATQPMPMKRTSLCASIGTREEHRAGCGGWNCAHVCQLAESDAEVAEHLGGVHPKLGVYITTPSQECQNCPKYSV